MCDSVTLYTSHLENIGSMNYADGLNVDTFNHVHVCVSRSVMSTCLQPHVVYDIQNHTP